MFPQFSRSRLQNWIKAGAVRVDGRRCRPRDAVAGGEQILLTAQFAPETAIEPQALALNILHEDAALLVINKPAGMVVHPGAGNRAGTLQNALLHHAPELREVPRAGIVHRLDKDTSGVLVVARSVEAHARLVKALAAREIGREYEAITVGVMTAGGSVDAPIGRHARDRKRMAVRDDGREAITHYRVIKRFRAHTHVAVKLETGRTHQIRVHLAHAQYPILGDPVYGRRLAIPKAAGPELADALRNFKRQALHARRLSLVHPLSGDSLSWEAPLPDDMRQLLQVLAGDARTHGG